MKKQYVILTFVFIVLLVLTFFYSCSPPKPEPIKVGSIPDNEFDPAEWGKVYPLHYESWLKTREAKPRKLSMYRKGWDDDKIVYDRLSEYPFLGLLYNGWGFGVEYNEPRGHFYAVTDQIEIDPSRIAPGGVCLSCKSPYHKSYVKKFGMKYLAAPFMKAIGMLPEKHRKLGPACVDCHQSNTMGLVTNKLHIEKGLQLLGKTDLTRQELRTMACAQCHMTYYVPRTQQGKVAGDVVPPWTGSSWGNISIENIIKDLLTDYKRLEWKQKVTGYKMPFIRHPEFELFSKSSVHWNAGVACSDCHMPYKRVGAYKISDHNVTSPVKANLSACVQCHTESATWLKKQIFTIQDRTASLLLRAGYGTAVSAKLIELVHKKQKEGISINQQLYGQAQDFYKKSFLRLIFIGAENSTGFHNPSEAARILGDAIAYSGKSEALLRQALASAGVKIPASIYLGLKDYLNNRGNKKLMFKRIQEVKDPFGIQEDFLSGQDKGL